MLKKLLVCISFAALIISPALADDLGPSSTSSVGSDPGTLNILQPANTGSIPTANALGGGINLPDTGTSLQPAGTKSDFPSSLDISSEADGSTKTTTSSSNHFNDIMIGIIGLALLLSAVFLFRISKLMEAQPAVVAPLDSSHEFESTALIDPAISEVPTDETKAATQTSIVEPKPTDQKRAQKRSRRHRKQ